MVIIKGYIGIMEKELEAIGNNYGDSIGFFWDVGRFPNIRGI